MIELDYLGEKGEFPQIILNGVDISTLAAVEIHRGNIRDVLTCTDLPDLGEDTISSIFS